MAGVRLGLVGVGGALVVLVAALLINADAGAAASAPEPSVVGKVVDATGAPVAQQPVVIEGAQGVATSVTNSEGRFIFYNLESGAYSVTIPGVDAEEAVFVPDQPWYRKWFRQPLQGDPATVDLELDVFKGAPGLDVEQQEAPAPK